MTTLFSKQGPDAGRYIGAVTAVLLALLSLAVSAYAAYARNDKATAERVNAVEVRQLDDRETMKRIETKLDHFIEFQTGMKP